MAATTATTAEFPSQARQRATYVELMEANKTLTPGDTWYVISHSWLTRWKKYVGMPVGSTTMSPKDAHNMSPHTGPIDNTQLYGMVPLC